jgi:hypothetical protein
MRNTVQHCLEFRSYVTGGMSGLLILVAFALGAAAVGFYAAALDEARPWFPPRFRNGYAPNFVVDGLIWERSFPARVVAIICFRWDLGLRFYCAWRSSLICKVSLSCGLRFLSIFIRGRIRRHEVEEISRPIVRNTNEVRHETARFHRGAWRRGIDHAAMEGRARG